VTDIEQALAEALRQVPYQHPNLGTSELARSAPVRLRLPSKEESIAAAILATEPMQAIAREAAVGRAMQRADFSLYPGEWDADWAWYCRFGTQPAYGGRTAFAAIAAALGEEATDD